MTAVFTNRALVSAVIPTHERADTLPRAIRSALSQTYSELEVIVVIDGLDVETTKVLGPIDDPRLRIIQLDTNRGPGEARNAGVAAARGEWIAFLDDDDEWLPEKIDKQLAWAADDCDEPIISCRFIARTNSGDYVWPRRFPRPAEPLSEYLFVRDGLSHNDGIILPLTILTRRSLLRRNPFPSNVKKHEDWEWLLTATSHPSVGLSFCPETLAIGHMTENNSAGRTADWQFSLNWIHANRAHVTARAYSGFITTHVGWQAAAQRSWSAFGFLLWDAFRNGSLRSVDVVRYCGLWFIPPSYRYKLKHRIRRTTARLTLAVGKL